MKVRKTEVVVKVHRGSWCSYPDLVTVGFSFWRGRVKLGSAEGNIPIISLLVFHFSSALIAKLIPALSLLYLFQAL